MTIPFRVGDRIVTIPEMFNPPMVDQGVVLWVWRKKGHYYVDADLKQYGKACLAADTVRLDLLGTLGDIR